jgi:signal transduction histidine kinase
LARERYVRRQQGALVPPRYEIRVVRPTGEVRHLVLSATAYWDSSQSARTVAQLLDITERTEAEQALRDYASELEIRNAELDAFADSVAHDLRNPLGTIMGFAETLLEAYDELTADEVRSALQSIARMGHKMDAIIDALLLFARVRKTAVKPTPVDMGPIVGEVLHRLEEMIAKKHAEIALPSHWPAALGYAPWLEEVWANLISNAISYGGNPPRVELGAELLPRGKVRFWVRDNGDGVSLSRQETLFSAFAQPGHKSGHGLGLSIVRRIIEKLDGSVGVESSGQAGEGSVFSFDLPAALFA